MTLAAGEVVESVSSRKVDIGLAYGPLQSSRLRVETIGNWSCACVFPAGHPLERLREVGVDDLQTEAILTYSDTSPTGTALRAMFDATHRPIEPVMTLSETPTVLDMVRRGLGVRLVDSFQHFALLYPELRARPLRPRIEVSAKVLTSAATARSGVVDVLVEEIRAAGRLAESRGWRPSTAPRA